MRLLALFLLPFVFADALPENTLQTRGIGSILRTVTKTAGKTAGRTKTGWKTLKGFFNKGKVIPFTPGKGGILRPQRYGGPLKGKIHSSGSRVKWSDVAHMRVYQKDII
jgi:hypothetical protein